MRRNAASGRSETPAELIARLTAENASSSALPPASAGAAAAVGTGRHHRRAESGTPSAVATAERPRERTAAVATDERPEELTAAVLAPERPEERTATVDAVAPLGGDEPFPGAGAPLGGGADVDTPTVGVPVVGADVPPSRARRLVSRKLAPVAVGAAVMLVATTVATVVATQDRSVAAPELSTAVRQEPSTTVPRPPTSAPPTTTLAPPPVVAAVAAPPTTQAPPPPKPKPATDGDGTQAAVRHGWKQVGGDEFNGSRYSDAWDAYEGDGHGGNGRRTRDAISVGDGVLTITGDSDGNTGGLAWKDSQRFGKWEMRAKFPAGDEQYHPVLLLWPNGDWPEGGEVDFAETTSASDQVSFFLHYSSENKQKYAHKDLDITQWHNYAVEWVDGRITGYVDGEKWFESTDRGTLPPDKMFAVIQLDWFPDGGAPRESKLLVDYVRIYS